MYVTFDAHSKQNMVVVTQDMLLQTDPKSEKTDVRKICASTYIRIDNLLPFRHELTPSFI